MAGDICDVCGRGNVVGVYSSSLGAISFAYCEECALNDAEPRGICVWQILDCGGLDKMRSDIQLGTRSYMNGAYLSMLEVAESITDQERAKYEKDMNDMAGPGPAET
jgi:hypothetical protein